MDGAKPASAPCTTAGKLSRFDGDPLADPFEYRHIVGALQYCTLTHPDIAYNINHLCQFLHSPTIVHMVVAKRALRYLKGTLEFGLHYTRGSLQLNGYCDSDWAGSPDDRNSTTGYRIYIGTCLIYWATKKQAVVAKSSIKAEYRSIALDVAEMYWLHMLFEELRIPLLHTPCLWVRLTILELSPYPLILCFMLARNTLKSIITSFERRFLTQTLLSAISLLMINPPIFLPKDYPRLGSFFFAASW
jgi:hypothetical protein